MNMTIFTNSIVQRVLEEMQFILNQEEMAKFRMMEKAYALSDAKFKKTQRELINATLANRIAFSILVLQMPCKGEKDPNKYSCVGCELAKEEGQELLTLICRKKKVL